MNIVGYCGIVRTSLLTASNDHQILSSTYLISDCIVEGEHESSYIGIEGVKDVNLSDAPNRTFGSMNIVLFVAFGKEKEEKIICSSVSS